MRETKEAVPFLFKITYRILRQDTNVVVINNLFFCMLTEKYCRKTIC